MITQNIEFYKLNWILSSGYSRFLAKSQPSFGTKSTKGDSYQLLTVGCWNSYLLIKCRTESPVKSGKSKYNFKILWAYPFFAQRANLDKYNKTLTCAFIGHKSINLCLFCMKDKGANVITLFSSEVKSTSRVRERGPGTISP